VLANLYLSLLQYIIERYNRWERLNQDLSLGVDLFLKRWAKVSLRYGTKLHFPQL